MQPSTAEVPFINHQRRSPPLAPARRLPSRSREGGRGHPCPPLVLPPPRPRGARWIFHLPFHSHSWRPASLNISPFALFIVGLKLASPPFGVAPPSPTFTGDAIRVSLALSSSRARAHAPARTRITRVSPRAAVFRARGDQLPSAEQRQNRPTILCSRDLIADQSTHRMCA